MSVILNELAIRALLEADTGPVMRDIERRAEAATAALNQRIEIIIENPFSRPQASFEMMPEGALIGIRNEGRVSEYLDVKLRREDWWDAVGKQAASRA